jgi:hypothetical protein
MPGRPDARIRGRVLLIKNDSTFYEVRFGVEFLDELSQEYSAFVSMSSKNKHIIFDALDDVRSGIFPIVRYHRENYTSFLNIIDNS